MGMLTAGNCNYFYVEGNENHQLEVGYFVQHRIFSAVVGLVFGGDSVSYIPLRGHWFNNSF